jgi:hypothetical protein
MPQRLKQIGELSSAGTNIENSFPTRQQRLDLFESRQGHMARA